MDDPRGDAGTHRIAHPSYAFAHVFRGPHPAPRALRPYGLEGFSASPKGLYES